MPDMHPIDDLFRQALSGAAVEPPTELGRSILAQARARRRRALLWRRRVLALVLLLLGSGAGMTWIMTSPIEEGALVEVSPPKSSSPVSGTPENSSANDRADDQPLGVVVAEPGRGDEQAQAPKASIESATRHELGSRGERKALATPEGGSKEIMDEERNGAANESREGAGSTASVTDVQDMSDDRLLDARAEFMVIRTAELTRAITSGMFIPAEAAEYYSPRGYWWLGLGVTAQAGRYGWDGDSEKLARALEGKRQWNPGLAYGISAGRGWPSGLSLGLGFEMERSEQTYRNVERSTVTRTETVEQVVVLNTHVFTTDVTTTEVQEQRESIAEGKDVRTRLRIPLEASWSLRRGRWTTGPRVGLIAERTYARSSSSLALDPEDGMVRARSLSDEEMRDRYPLAFSGFAGFDIGFSLRERITVLATPFYSQALLTTNSSTDAKALPERAGLRLQIQHRF